MIGEKKITALDIKASLADDDLINIVDSEVSANKNKNSKLSTFIARVLAGLTGATYASNFINNLLIENDTTTITVKAGLKIIANANLYSFTSDSVLTPATVAGGGYYWGFLGCSETNGTLASLNLADVTNAGYALSAATNQLDLNTLYDNTKGYCVATVGSVNYRLFGVFKYITGFTDATVDTNTTEATIRQCACDSTTKLTIGMSVSQTGAADIPANTEIVEITNETTFIINNPASGSHSNITMIVASSIYNIIEIIGKPKTYIKLNSSIAQAVSGVTIINLNSINLDLNAEITGGYNGRVFTASYTNKFNIYISFNMDGASTGGGYGVFYLYKNSANIRHLYNETSLSAYQQMYMSFYYNSCLYLKHGETINFKVVNSYDSITINTFNLPNNVEWIIEGC